MHQLEVISRFIANFLAIHPFQDGNDRVARSLTSLLLLRAMSTSLCIALRVIDDNTTQYYVALRDSQLAMRNNAGQFGT